MILARLFQQDIFTDEHKSYEFSSLKCSRICQR